jgi:hypothetical protein
VKKIRSRLTYANVMASLAVFLVLGGGAAFAALGKNTVGTKQLKKNAVTTAKIKKNAVTTAKIRNGAVTGAKLKLDSIGTVPSASHADSAGTADSAGNANTVGGNSVVAINFTGDSPIGLTQILNLDGFTLTATCSAGDVLSVVVSGPGNSRLQSAANESAGGTAVTNQAFSDDLGGGSVELLPEDDDQVVGNTQLYNGAGGRNVSITWEAESFGLIPSPRCAFTGYAIG